MSDWKIFTTWALLILIAFAIYGVQDQVKGLRDEFQDARERYLPEDAEAIDEGSD